MELRHYRWQMLACAVSAFALANPAYATGNKYTFDRAATSAVDYRATPHEAVMPCPDIKARAGSAITFHVTLIPAAAGVPEHCRIDGILPTEIGFQINLPTSWNGRIYMYGNGGYAGEAAESAREQRSRDQALKNGFATVRTDTGHLAAKEPLATFAVDPQKLVNHGYGAVHATITYAKTLAAAFYGLGPRHAYWDGCSTGGREGVMSAQRFPADFDGIVAAAPTLDWSSIMIKGLWNRSALAGSGLTFDKMGEVFKAVMAKCDDLDGVKDGLIGDPRRCDFDPARDLPRCANGHDSTACFTPVQVSALQKIHSGPPKGAAVPLWDNQLPGFEHPSTMEPFVMMANGSPDILTIFAESWTKFIGFKNANYDPSTFNFEHDPALIRGADEIFNPTSDLVAFKQRGGKMITFWGWADTALNPQMGISYYDKVVGQYGLKGTQDFYRLFLVPGVAHCSGGYGPDDIDTLTAVINWVEAGVVPERLSARREQDGKVQYNREYCPYPAITKYKGSGDPEDPRNFSCLAPARK